MVEEHSGYDVLGEIKINGASGTAGQSLRSGGAGASPTFANVTRELFLPANEGYVESGTPAANFGYYSGVSGGQDADEPIIYFTMKVPDDFVSFTSVTAIWVVDGTGNMYWQLLAYYAACGEAVNTHTDEPAIGVTASGGANIINCQAPANALTLASLAAGDIIGVAFNREGTHGNDTLTDVPTLLGLLFTYVGHQ